ELELTTFYVDELLLGLDIHQVEEINRQLNMTPAPHTPDTVRGVVNLRGEVVTVLDLRRALGLEPTIIGAHSRNVIVNSRGERIGLLVDRIADVVIAATDQIESPPANVNGIDGRFFTGVYKLESELVVILDIEQVVSGQQ
ncbi:MAG: chemotaxis protein CheW, partial [Planctomycetes bacterium]|nr:chemotaxis protein CheW [Planctomycetota bacterium]